MTPLLLIAAGVALILIGLRLLEQPLARDAITSWHTPIPQVEDDAQTVYARIYQGLKDGLQERQVELKGMGFGPVRLFESHSIFSARPLYFCAKYKHLTYYIYGMSTPYGMFLSTWLFNKYVKGSGEKALILPGAFKYYAKETLFQHDAVHLFQTMMHGIVLDVVESYRQDKGLPPLQEYEKRPVYSAFYQKDFPQPPLVQQTVMQQSPFMQQPVTPDSHISQPPFPFQHHFAQPNISQPTTQPAAGPASAVPLMHPVSSQASNIHHPGSPLQGSPIQAVFSDVALQPSGGEPTIQKIVEEPSTQETTYRESAHHEGVQEPGV